MIGGEHGQQALRKDVRFMPQRQQCCSIEIYDRPAQMVLDEPPLPYHRNTPS